MWNYTTGLRESERRMQCEAESDRLLFEHQLNNYESAAELQMITDRRAASLKRGDQTLSAQSNQTDYSQFIAENFGANATYVETLLQRFRSDPALVDESWRAYFMEMLGGEPAATAA